VTNAYLGEQCDNGTSRNYPTSAAALAAGVGYGVGYCNSSCKSAVTVAAPRCGDGNVDAGEQCDNGSKNYQSVLAAQSAGVPANTQFCTTWCSLLMTPPPAPVCGNGVQDSGEQCDLGSRNGNAGSGCTSSCQCAVDLFVSDASTRVVDANGNDLGAAVAQTAGLPIPPQWPNMSPAQFVWSFDESNPALAPANWATVDNIVYFKKTFTITHPAKSVILQMTSDNAIDQVVVDGRDVTAAVPGGPIQNLGIIYAMDITQYLGPGLTHTVVLKADNYHNFNPVSGNPAMLVFSITSNPSCTAN
jgi:hypothetical protein